MSQELGRRGHQVFVTGRNEHNLKRVAAAVRESGGSRCELELFCRLGFFTVIGLSRPFVNDYSAAPLGLGM